MKLYKFEIISKQAQSMINIDHLLLKALGQSQISNGKITVFCPHTTAGITINENADPDVSYDMINALERAFPKQGDYRHFEGNSHAHVKSSFMGVSQMVLVENNQLVLGTWQSVFFCEFDGPRQRKVVIAIEGESNG